MDSCLSRSSIWSIMPQSQTPLFCSCRRCQPRYDVWCYAVGENSSNPTITSLAVFSSTYYVSLFHFQFRRSLHSANLALSFSYSKYPVASKNVLLASASGFSSSSVKSMFLPSSMIAPLVVADMQLGEANAVLPVVPGSSVGLAVELPVPLRYYLSRYFWHHYLWFFCRLGSALKALVLAG